MAFTIKCPWADDIEVSLSNSNSDGDSESFGDIGRDSGGDSGSEGSNGGKRRAAAAERVLGDGQGCQRPCAGPPT